MAGLSKIRLHFKLGVKLRSFWAPQLMMVLIALLGFLVAVALWSISGLIEDGRRVPSVNLVSWRPSSLSSIVEFIESNKLLLSRNEAAHVVEAKKLIGKDVSHFYFDSLWQILDYLRLTNSDKEIEALISSSLENGWFNVGEACVNFRKCQRRVDANATLIDAESLADFMEAYHVDRSLVFLGEGDYVQARGFARVMLKILRAVDTPVSDPSNERLGKIYVYSIFLALADPSSPASSAETLRRFWYFSKENIHDKVTGNLYMDGYMGAVALLRKNCYSDAASQFEYLFQRTSFDYLQELFAMLAMRSYYKPLIDLEAMVLDSHDKKVYIYDCEKTVDLPVWVDRVEIAKKNLSVFIDHEGFRTDISEYSAGMLWDKVKREELYVQLSGKVRDISGLEGAASERSSVPDQSIVSLNDPAVDGGLSGLDSSLMWPVRGAVIANFGFQETGGAPKLDGIRLSVPEGTPVKAADHGMVIYAGNGLKELGDAVLIRHESRLVTVYGHLSEALVVDGQQVARGETIAMSGAKGVPSGRPMLHFEVRLNAAPVDPVRYLQK